MGGLRWSQRCKKRGICVRNESLLEIEEDQQKAETNRNQNANGSGHGLVDAHPVSRSVRSGSLQTPKTQTSIDKPIDSWGFILASFFLRIGFGPERSETANGDARCTKRSDRPSLLDDCLSFLCWMGGNGSFRRWRCGALFFVFVSYFWLFQDTRTRGLDRLLEISVFGFYDRLKEPCVAGSCRMLVWLRSLRGLDNRNKGVRRRQSVCQRNQEKGDLRHHDW